mgnify:CR=1 FL=1
MHRVLIIDDDPIALNMMNLVIENLGYKTQCFSEPQKALDWLTQNDCSLVLTDYEMPHISGIEVLKAVKEQHQNIPVVIITAYSNLNLIREALVSGAFDFVEKPLNPKYVNEVFRLATTFNNVPTNYLPAIRNITPQHKDKAQDETTSNILNYYFLSDLVKAIGYEKLNSAILEFIQITDISMEKLIHSPQNLQTQLSFLHRLIGTAASLGLTQLEQHCHAMQQEFKNSDSPIPDQNIQAIKETYMLSCQRLKKYLSEVTTPSQDHSFQKIDN